jgi:hypothetical protein
VNEFSPEWSIGQSVFNGGGVGIGAFSGTGSLHKNRADGASGGAASRCDEFCASTTDTASFVPPLSDGAVPG